MILLVEDNDVARGAVASLLRDRGYCVTECANGHEALVQLEARRNCIQVLVLDLIMSNGSGQWLLLQMSHQPRLVPPFVIITTAMPDPIPLPKAPCPVRVLQKPFTVDELVCLIEEGRGAANLARPVATDGAVGTGAAGKVGEAGKQV